MIERNTCVRKGNTKYLGIPCQKICLKGSFKKNLWSNKRFFRIKIQIQSQGKAFKNCSITASIFFFIKLSLNLCKSPLMTLYHKVCWINHVGVIKLDEKRKENLKNNRLREEKVIRSLWRVFRRFKIFHRRTTGSEDLAPLCSDFKCISKFPSDLARFLVRQCEDGKKKKEGNQNLKGI